MKLVKEESFTEKDEELGVFDKMEDAIDAAYEAQKVYSKLSYKKRKEIVDSFRNGFRKYVNEVSEMAVEETGMGRVEDKISKTLLVLDKTPGVEDLKTEVTKGDEGIILDEFAPFGNRGYNTFNKSNCNYT